MRFSNLRVLLTGGGTGGHVLPLISVAKEINALTNNTASFYFLGAGSALGKDIWEKEGIEASTILSGKIRRYLSAATPIDLFIKLPLGIVQSLWKLLVIMPDLVISKGGYGSVPVVIAAWLYHIPVLLHESDVRPGLANRILSKLSRNVAVSFPKAAEYFPAEKVVFTGNPVRAEIGKISREEGLRYMRLASETKTIFVTGGSQGAKQLNDLFLLILPKLLLRWQVIHQCGESQYQEVKKIISERLNENMKRRYVLKPFLTSREMAASYAAADLVVARAGANTISEIARAGRSSVLIPLPGSANDHQRANAFHFAKEHAALVLDEENLREHLLFSRIEELLEKDDLRGQMAKNVEQFSVPGAAGKIAEGALTLINWK